MNEGEIRQLAQLFALQAEMHAVVAEIEAVKIVVANQKMLRKGGRPVCDEKAFEKARDELFSIAHAMRTKI